MSAKCASTVEATLTLSSIMIEPEKIVNTPSHIQHGLDSDSEVTLRSFACSLIQRSCNILDLPQQAAATAQIIFQRFYYQKSLITNNYILTAIACISIASKVEECHQILRKIIVVFSYVYDTALQNKRELLELNQYKIKKNKVHLQEFKVLAALGYNVWMNNPHKIIFVYLKLLNLLDNQFLMQSAWNYMNDCLRSPSIFSFHKPEIIATACICLAARKQCIPLPNDPDWLPLFNTGVSDSQILEIISLLLMIYKVDTSLDAVKQSEAMVQNLIDGHTNNNQQIKISSPSSNRLSDNLSIDAIENTRTRVEKSSIKTLDTCAVRKKVGKKIDITPEYGKSNKLNNNHHSLSSKKLGTLKNHSKDKYSDNRKVHGHSKSYSGSDRSSRHHSSHHANKRHNKSETYPTHYYSPTSVTKPEINKLENSKDDIRKNISHNSKSENSAASKVKPSQINDNRLSKHYNQQHNNRHNSKNRRN